MEYIEFEKFSKKLSEKLIDIKKEWDGKDAILEMKEAGFNQWRQMEWIGFYFEFLCNNIFSGDEFSDNVFRDEDIKYGNVKFDFFFEIPWDYKAHAMNTSSHSIVVNDEEAVADVVNKYGAIGIILSMGEVEYNDKDRSFQKWHSKLKGGKSKYEEDRIKRGAWSRLRKTKFTLKQILFIKIDNNVLESSGSFQEGFRNADGSKRRSKITLNLENLKDDDYYTLNF